LEKTQSKQSELPLFVLKAPSPGKPEPIMQSQISFAVVVVIGVVRIFDNDYDKDFVDSLFITCGVRDSGWNVSRSLGIPSALLLRLLFFQLYGVESNLNPRCVVVAHPRLSEGNLELENRRF
jgi:hypothetical protein